MIKRTTTCTISDIANWYDKEELELSPKYQRNGVWNENAKSYLIDTIVKGFPIPPIFIRSRIDVNTRKTNREVLDGQQRIRTILSFLNNEFKIKKNHNAEFGNMKFDNLDDDIKGDFLGYEISVEYITETDDSKVYDMFSRLNSNNYVLNKQEVRNAIFWGDFKVLAYKLAAKYRSFFIDNMIFNDKDCIRMRDVELINSLMIIQLEGIIGENQTVIDDIYRKYDASIGNYNNVENNIDKCMVVIDKIYKNNLGNIPPFNNKNYFFSLFMVVYHQLFGINGCEKIKRKKIYDIKNINNNIILFANSISKFVSDYCYVFETKDTKSTKYEELLKFDIDNRNRTTNKDGRIRRINFLNEYLIR